MPLIKDISIRTQKEPAQDYFNLYTWGGNQVGVLGDGTTTKRSSPVLITDDIATVSGGGYDNSYFITNSGELFSTGRNTNGQLGINTTTNVSTPVQVGTDTDWWMAEGGNLHALFLKDFSPFYSGSVGGKLFAVGYNLNGELGQGDTTSRSSPVQVGAVTSWIQIAAGNSFSLAIEYSDDNYGALYAWGGNSYGELGLGDQTARSTPTFVNINNNTLIAAGGFASLVAIWDNMGDVGDVYSCGQNNYGQLGLSDTTNRSSLVSVTGGSGFQFANIVAVATSGEFSAIIVSSDGSPYGNIGYLYTCGRNDSGQLGLGDTTNRSSFVQVGAGGDWVDVKLADFNAIAQKSDGTIWTWGTGFFGALGTGESIFIDKSSPVQVGSDTAWIVKADYYGRPTIAGGGQGYAAAIRDST
jgi:alpha-tubulin suppressor-like RCC1 family protein